MKNLEENPFSNIPLTKIITNPDQPRKSFENIDELAESIEKHGVIHPIMVIEIDEQFMIIAGERRFRAVQELGHETITAQIMDVDSFSVQELTLVENIQREDLTPFETAMYVNALSYRYASAVELAAKLGKSPSYISKCKSVLNLSDPIKEDLAELKHDIGFEVLQELGRVEDTSMQKELYDKKATREEIRAVCREEKEGTKSVPPPVEEPMPEKLSPAKVEVAAEETSKKTDSHSEHFEYYNMYYGSNGGSASIKESKTGAAGRGIYFDAASSTADEKGSSLCLVTARDANFWCTTRNNIPKDVKIWNERLRSSPYHGIIIMSESGAEEEIVIFYPEKITVDREWGTTEDNEPEKVSPAKVEDVQTDAKDKEAEHILPAKKRNKLVMECLAYQGNASEPLKFMKNDGVHTTLDGYLHLENIHLYKQYKITIEEI